MKKAQIYFAVISMVVLGLIYSLNYPSPKLRPVFQTVNFCGTSYQVEKVMIDGVDMIKRIAELATAETKKFICDELKGNVKSSILSVKIEEKHPNEFWLDTGGPIFVIHPSLNRIWKDDPFGGFYVGTIK